MVKKFLFFVLGLIAVILSVSLVLGGSGEPLVYPPNISIIHPVNGTTYTSGNVDLNWTSNESVDWIAYNLDGVGNISFLTYSDCSQESTNGSHISDGTCNLNYSGGYEISQQEGGWSSTNNASKLYDEDYNSFAYAQETNPGTYVNHTYYKPLEKVEYGTRWYYKYKIETQAVYTDTIIINQSCLVNKSVKLRAYANFPLGEVVFQCLNGSNQWGTMFIREAFENPTNYYEEKIIWNTSTFSNITLSELSDGMHNLTLFGNDSSGNKGQSSYVYFSVDTKAPALEILSPLNNSFHATSSVDLNWTTNETLSSCSYSLDGSANNTAICPSTLSGYPSTVQSGDATQWGSSINFGTGTYDINDANWANGDATFSVYLNSTNYGFSIPSNASIKGIEVVIERKQANTAVIHDAEIRLSKDYNLLPANGSTGDVWSLTSERMVYGSSTDTWGTTWLPSDINNQGFGTSLKVYAVTGGDDGAQVDYMQIKVYYMTNITLTGLSDGVHNITIYANDTDGNRSQSTYVYFTTDIIAPSFPSNSINNSAPKINEVVGLGQNVSDASANVSIIIFFHNQSGAGFLNVSNTSTLNAKSINYTPNLTITLSRGNVIGYGFWANDSLDHVNTTAIRTFTVANTIPVCTASTLNNTSPKTNDVINQSGCSYSDADSDAQGTSQYKWYLNNAEIAGETSPTLNLGTAGNGNRGQTINASERPYDGTAYGNWVNVSAFATIQDTIPNVSIGVNNSLPTINQVVNVSSNISGEADNLGFCLIKTNISGVFVNNTFSFSGTSGFCSDPITMNVAHAVVNFTIMVNDSVGGIIYENSTKVTVVNSAPSFTSTAISPNAPNTTTTLSGTTSGYSDPDSDSESGSTYKWYKNGAVVAGETTTSLAGTNFVRADAIIFEATPNDGTDFGSPVNSSVTLIVDSPVSFSIVINNTSPRINEVVKISGNATDDDILSMTIFSWNMSGAWLNVSNITLSAAGNNYTVNQTVTLTRGNVIGYVFYSNDSIVSTFTASSLNTFTVANTLPTCVASTLNSTSPKTNDVINQSGCSYSDADSDAQGTSQYKWYLNNAEIAGETSPTLNLGTAGNGNRGQTINASERPYDGTAYGNWVNVSAFATIQDTIPNVSIGVNNSLPTINQVVNVSSNISGEADNLGFCLIKTNISGVFVNNTFSFSGTSGFCSDPITMNVAHAVVNFTIMVNDSVGGIIYENSTKITIQNTVATVASATINNSNPIDSDDLECLNGTLFDADGDAVTRLYNWTKNGIDQAISTATLSKTLTTANDIWICKITPYDGFANGTTQTSASVSIGTGYFAPAINATNATPRSAELLKGQVINLSANISDINNEDKHTVHFCKSNSADSDGCSGDTWCSSEINVTGNFTSCLINVTNSTGFPTLSEYTFYACAVDNTTLASSCKSNTFTIQDITAPVILDYDLSAVSIIDGNKINLTMDITENVSNLQTITFNLTNPNGVNLQRSNPTYFTLPSTKTLLLNYTIFETSETSVIGIWNWTYASVNELSGNKIEIYPNLTFTINAVPSPSPTGAGSATENVPKETKVVTCQNAGLNYSVSNLQRNLVFGYSLITDRENVKPKCRELLLRNFGSEEVTIGLKCNDDGVNLTSGFCQFVELKKTQVVLPPNPLVEETVEMCIIPLKGQEIEGNQFFFSIQSTDQINACKFQLSNELEVSSFFAKFVTWREIDLSDGKNPFQFPLIIPAIFGGIAIFAVSFIVMRLLKVGSLKAIYSLMLFLLTFVLVLLLF